MSSNAPTRVARGGTSPAPAEHGIARFFKFQEHKTTFLIEILAGVTSFMMMSYIVIVNPLILGFAGVKGLEGRGLPFSPVVTSTCLVAAVMSIAMGLYSNRAYVVAPGMGLNAVVAYTLVIGNGLSWPEAMGIVVLEGAAVTLLVLSGVRGAIMDAVPLELKKSIAVGIGLFIAFIGLSGAKIVVQGNGTPLAFGDIVTWPKLVAVFGLIITLFFRARGFKASLLLGIVVTTIGATLLNAATGYKAFTTPGVAKWPGWSHFWQAPDFSLVGHVNFNAFHQIGVVATLVLVFALFLSDFFDMMGTIVGVGQLAGYLDKYGNLPRAFRALLIDALSAIFGGLFSASSATTYVESGAGVEAGGRTGFVAVVAGSLFLPAMFFSPLIGMVPSEAVMAALLIVGWQMATVLVKHETVAESGVKRHLAGIDFSDPALGLASFFTIVMMPLTYSITNGIGVGFIVYTVVRVFQGQWRKVHLFMYVSAAAFALYYAVPAMQAHGWL